MYDKDGTLVRVNLAVSGCVYCCCAKGLARSGLDDSDTERIPIELREVAPRLDLATWQDWVEELAKAQDAYSCTFLRVLNCIFFPCSILPCFTKGTILQRDKLLREWQATVNKALARLGDSNLYIKTQSLCVITHTHDGKRQRHVYRWISVALTADEVVKLSSEPHLSGNTDNCACCGGVDENELCWHH